MTYKPSTLNKHPRLKWYALLTVVLIALLGLYLTLRMYRVITPITIPVLDPLTSLLKVFFVWTLIALIWTIWTIVSDYRQYSEEYLSVEERIKKEEKREKRWAKIIPHIYPTITFFQEWVIFIRVNAWDIHEWLQRFNWYWRLQEKAFNMNSLYLGFKNDNDPGKLRVFIARTIYVWPQVIGIVLTIGETFLYHQFNWTRSYVGALLFYYLVLKLIRFWALEHYSWFGPLIIFRQPELFARFDWERYDHLFYTRVTKEGILVPKRENFKIKWEKLS